MQQSNTDPDYSQAANAVERHSQDRADQTTFTEHQFSGSMPVQPRHAFDLQSLQRFMSKQVEGFSGSLEVEQFRGGQSNPTFLLRAGGKRYVLRRRPAGKLLKSAHAIDREYRVLAALAQTSIPVPKTYCYCSDETVLGSTFFIMEYVEGRIFWDQSLPTLSPPERSQIYDEMNQVLTALHEVDYQSLGLTDFGRHEDYFARHIKRWSEQYRAAETAQIDAMDRLIAWLPDNIPPGNETSLVHGDYRIDNLIFHPSEHKVIGILDWELSTLGHPLADLAYHCTSWHVRPEEARGIAGLDLVKLGIPSESDYVAAYCQRTNRSAIENWDFYISYNFFRMAAISQGVFKRGIDGNASNERALEAGKRASAFATLGWARAQRIVARS